MNELEEGCYYWVKYKGAWYVGKFETIRWEFPAIPMYSCDFEEIGDKVNVPENIKSGHKTIWEERPHE